MGLKIITNESINEDASSDDFNWFDFGLEHASENFKDKVVNYDFKKN